MSATSLSTGTTRQPKGTPVGGQFTASARGETGLSLAATDPVSGPEPEAVPEADFSDEWPSLSETDARRGTVRTTNGGEVSGTIVSHGTSYDVDVFTDDGRRVSLPAWRVGGVRLDPAAPGAPEPQAPWPGTDFPREWPRMNDSDKRTGTVRTTNGGEVSGTLSSLGTSFAIDVLTDDGRYVSLMQWRVAGVRLDPDPAQDPPKAPTNPDTPACTCACDCLCFCSASASDRGCQTPCAAAAARQRVDDAQDHS